MTNLDELIEHHKKRCCRFVNGNCFTRSCLIQGGWDGKLLPFEFDKASCYTYETVNALIRLKDLEK